VRILICGSRNFTNRKVIELVLSKYPKDTIVIEGGAKGADTLAKELAIEMGMKIEEYPAQWKTYHRAAGPIRNTKMLVDGTPEIVYAFYQNKAKSKGTANMVAQAREAGVKVVEYEEEE
jgi:hypothetical protein